MEAASLRFAELPATLRASIEGLLQRDLSGPRPDGGSGTVSDALTELCRDAAAYGLSRKEMNEAVKSVHGASSVCEKAYYSPS